MLSGALGFRSLANYITRSLLDTGGFRPRLHTLVRDEPSKRSRTFERKAGSVGSGLRVPQLHSAFPAARIDSQAGIIRCGRGTGGTAFVRRASHRPTRRPAAR